MGAVRRAELCAAAAPAAALVIALLTTSTVHRNRRLHKRARKRGSLRPWQLTVVELFDVPIADGVGELRESIVVQVEGEAVLLRLKTARSVLAHHRRAGQRESAECDGRYWMAAHMCLMKYSTLNPIAPILYRA